MSEWIQQANIKLLEMSFPLLHEEQVDCDQTKAWARKQQFIQITSINSVQKRG